MKLLNTKIILLCFAILLPGWVGASGQSEVAARRIVSINLCTDQLLLLLADRQRIASLSFMAGNPVYSAYAERVGDIPLNHARVEEIVALQPDLVLAYELSDTQLVGFLRQLGYRVELIPASNTLPEVERTVMTVAGLLGEKEAGAAVVAQMRQALASRRVAAAAAAPLAVIYAPNGYSPGSETLQGAVLEAAGFSNLSRRLDNAHGATIPLEQLLAHEPELFIISDEEPNENSLAQRKLNHPALRSSMARGRVAHVTGRYWSCPTPELIHAVDQLRAYLF